MKIFSFNLWLTILFAKQLGKYFHVVMRFSVSFASISVPFPPSLYLIICLSKGHSDFVLYFSSLNVLGLGFTFKSDVFQLISVHGVKYYLSFSLRPKIYLMGWLSFPYLVALAPFKINCVYMHRLISEYHSGLLI